ncbi:hypothetical protein QYF36_026835 [Acer negundo]|nr:hypothetical protein QYF36_026835 [Acer negundo]
MSDWGPVFVAVILFVLLTPGLLFQLPGKQRCVEFGNFQTSGAAIMVHALLYFALICVFLLAVRVHFCLLVELIVGFFGSFSQLQASVCGGETEEDFLLFTDTQFLFFNLYTFLHSHKTEQSAEVSLACRYQREREREMADWGPVVIAVVLFVLLSPGLLFQLPGRSKVVEFGNMQTSGLSILIHTVIFFGLITIFLIAIGVHIYTG